MIDRGQTLNKMSTLRRVCSGCPVAGHCLREALAEDPTTRAVGPLRVGHSGPVWRSIASVAVFLEVTTDDDHDTLAAWLLDGVLRLRKLSHRRWEPVLLDDPAA
jgi:hypothetical protein